METPIDQTVENLILGIQDLQFLSGIEGGKVGSFRFSM